MHSLGDRRPFAEMRLGEDRERNQLMSLRVALTKIGAERLVLPCTHFFSVTKAILLPASSAIRCPSVAADKR